MPGRFSDCVNIQSATTGVTGTIIVSENAHLRELVFAEVDDDGVLTEVELTWTSSPSPLKFVPNRAKQLVATNGAGIAFNGNIPLDVTVKNATTVTIKCTSTGTMAGLIVGLRWD